MLIAPLDWGLGHATRCIPIIRKMLDAGFKVIIAAEGDQKILLNTEFPELEMVHLPGYNLKYASTKNGTLLKLIFQIPKILIAINREKNWLREIINDKPLDIVLSDNRFGLHHKKIVTVFITHQLAIKTSLGHFIDVIVQHLNYRFIAHFNQCWVPDLKGPKNLAGELSHPVKLPPVALTYIGLQSRISQQQLPITYKLLILLSGPEPQRTILENIILAQLTGYALPTALVRGLPEATTSIPSSASLMISNYLSGPQLQQIINQSDIIISRSGYSTIMDVLPLGKKCIFIPTPGQAEQAYLAAYLSGRHYAVTIPQHKFSLALMIEKAEKLQPGDFSFTDTGNQLDTAIKELLTTLKSKKQSD